MKNFLLEILKRTLGFLAKLTLWRFKPKVIAITGSVGKTSAKEAIYAVLKNYRKTRKSVMNLNNELGLPISIIGDWPESDLKLVSKDFPAGRKKGKKFLFWLRVITAGFLNIIIGRKKSYPEIIILEYGADRPGDIKKLTDIAKPNVGVITLVGEIPVHVEFFSGPEAVAREKAKLIEVLFSNDFAVLNFDNPIVMNMKEKTRAKIVTFGFNEGADLRISNLENYFDNGLPSGISFKMEYGGSIVPVNIKNSFGKSSAYASAAAACAGLIFDLNLVEISEALSLNYKSSKGRMKFLKLKNGATLIDDSYNASPDSMKELIETVSGIPAKRKIAILGDMLELGDYSEESHKEVGRLSANVFNVLICIGEKSVIVASSAKRTGFSSDALYVFENADKAIGMIKSIIEKGDLIAVKGSRAIGLDKTVEEIIKG